MPDLGMKYREQFARNKNRKLVQIFFFTQKSVKFKQSYFSSPLLESMNTINKKGNI